MKLLDFKVKNSARWGVEVYDPHDGSQFFVDYTSYIENARSKFGHNSTAFNQLEKYAGDIVPVCGSVVNGFILEALLTVDYSHEFIENMNHVVPWCPELKTDANFIMLWKQYDIKYFIERIAAICKFIQNGLNNLMREEGILSTSEAIVSYFGKAFSLYIRRLKETFDEVYDSGMPMEWVNTVIIAEEQNSIHHEIMETLRA